MTQANTRAQFYAHVANRTPAHWPVAPGVAFYSRAEHHHWGMALHLAHRALGPEQWRDALRRRFAQAEVFDGYFLFMDAQREAVVWWPLGDKPSTPAQLDEVRQRALALVGVTPLAE